MPDPSTGLDFPPHHGEPPSPPPAPTSRPRADEQPTRKRMQLWDRVKVVVALLGTWFVLVWASMSDNPLLPFRDAARQQVRSAWWLLTLAVLEVLRQVHYLISERSPAYHQSWKGAFAAWERRVGRIGDWNRYRLGKLLRVAFVAVLVAVILGKVFHTTPVLALFEVPGRIISALPLLFQFLLIMLVSVGQFAAIFWFLSKGGVETYFPDDVKTRFSDVWGQDGVLERVKENIVFLEDPEAIEEKGGYVPSGILLWGPPGTGKTLMAEAVAGETGKPYVFVDPGAFKAMFIGIDVLKVKSLFRRLRKLSLRYGGVICFLDEADTLGNRGQLAAGGFGGAATPAPWSVGTTASCNGFAHLDQVTQWQLARAQMGGDEPRAGDRNRMVMGMGGGGALQTLLTELSGLKKPKGIVNRYVRKLLGFRPKPPPKYRILMMMATNMPQALDEALLRPGRLDRIYRVGYPSKEGRIRTYQGYFDKVSHQLTAEQVEKLATITPYATGATIKDLVNEALIYAIREGRETITWKDVISAKHLKDLGPPEDVEYIERERHAVAIHEACHAVAALRVRQHMSIDLATIEKGSGYLGMVASIPPEEQFTRWRSEYESDIVVSVASLAGERLFFGGDNSSGVSGDLESATMIAAFMEGYWGMGDTVTAHGVSTDLKIGAGGKRKKPEEGKEPNLLGGSLGVRVEERLARLLQDAEDLLRENRAQVLAVAHALETRKTLTGEDVEAIIDGLEGPLVDGRTYYVEGFQAQLESYHQQAVLAHERHSRVDAPLPALPPYGGPGVHGATWVLVPDRPVAASTPDPDWPAWPGSDGGSNGTSNGGSRLVATSTPVPSPPAEDHSAFAPPPSPVADVVTTPVVPPASPVATTAAAATPTEPMGSPAAAALGRLGRKARAAARRRRG